MNFTLADSCLGLQEPQTTYPIALNNSADLVKQLEIELDEDEVLVSNDVLALFTRVTVDKSLEVIVNLCADPTLSTRTKLATHKH